MEIYIDDQPSLAEVSAMIRPLTERLSPMLSGTAHHEEMIGLIEEQTEEWQLKMKQFIEYYLHQMKEMEASDIDMGGPGCVGQIWFRIHGYKKPIAGDAKLTPVETDILLLNLLLPRQRKILFEERNFDFSYTMDTDEGLDQRFRADIYYDMDHLALNMRRIDNEIRPFKGLELHPEVSRAVSLKYYQYGLTLVTGITGSGKSSTLDTIIDANNRSMEAHVVIIASPVELVHKPIRSIIRHREVGRDVASFKEGAVQALRQDPDIIVIGELRDPETIQTALEITDSGHKTFGTLHTSSAMESIDRIIGEIPVDEQNRVRMRLADVLTCVISQKLIPSLDGKRVLAKEVLLVTPSVKAAIRNNNIGEIYQMLMEGGKMGMHTMEQDLKRLCDQGKISKEMALNNSNNKKRMEKLLNPSAVDKLNTMVG
ncbi:type IV pilus twitching motility protein PilT [Fodinibius salsisoli]|uniref:Flp pilus assembly complex ATPase component TadA n=1 Tax=Fodinibius salsisoli TaxID=2820877 RepID=A0ABT3PLN5_9BACT|nr:ATPase, T2SS/T4P/T4SS family [Fodinibius salsisoli]MCW9706812.1 Flp pilus assembly complex ATPase component TadA [Fodinibius salsisoli]